MRLRPSPQTSLQQVHQPMSLYNCMVKNNALSRKNSVLARWIERTSSGEDQRTSLSWRYIKAPACKSRYLLRKWMFFNVENLNLNLNKCDLYSLSSFNIITFMPWDTMSYLEIQWAILRYNEQSWDTMSNLEIQWAILRYNEISWDTMSNLEIQWAILRYIEQSWDTMSNLEIHWAILRYIEQSWDTMSNLEIQWTNLQYYEQSGDILAIWR